MRLNIANPFQREPQDTIEAYEMFWVNASFTRLLYRFCLHYGKMDKLFVRSTQIRDGAFSTLHHGFGNFFKRSRCREWMMGVDDSCQEWGDHLSSFKTSIGTTG